MLKQPGGLCDDCLRLANDPVLNCPVAQMIRETSCEFDCTACPDFISIVSNKYKWSH